jgi:hypothetical protein
VIFQLMSALTAYHPAKRQPSHCPTAFSSSNLTQPIAVGSAHDYNDDEPVPVKQTKPRPWRPARQTPPAPARQRPGFLSRYFHLSFPGLCRRVAWRFSGSGARLYHLRTGAREPHVATRAAHMPYGGCLHLECSSLSNTSTHSSYLLLPLPAELSNDVGTGAHGPLTGGAVYEVGPSVSVSCSCALSDHNCLRPTCLHSLVGFWTSPDAPSFYKLLLTSQENFLLEC